MTLRSTLLTLMLCAASAACGSDADPAGADVPEPADPSGPTSMEQLVAFAWIGEWEGIGAGVQEGESVTIRPARLRVRFDADSVKLPRCPLCVTVTLDSVFSLVNAGLDDAVRVALTYERDGVRRTLRLERFSSGVQTGNVLQAHLFVEPLSGSGAVTDLTYLLELR